MAGLVWPPAVCWGHDPSCSTTQALWSSCPPLYSGCCRKIAHQCGALPVACGHKCSKWMEWIGEWNRHMCIFAESTLICIPIMVMQSIYISVWQVQNAIHIIIWLWLHQCYKLPTRSTKEMWITCFVCLHAFGTYRTCAEVFNTGMGWCNGFYWVPLHVTKLECNWEYWWNTNEWYLNKYHRWKHDCGIPFAKQYDWMENATETHGE